MKAWILPKSNLSYFLRQMRKKMELIAPLRERGDIIFKTVERIHEIELQCPASMPPLKEFLAPQFEPMLRFAGGAVEDLAVDSKRVVFGARSCDVAALKRLDRFYLDGLKDPYYAARRRGTFFISIVCGRPDAGCFCAGLGSGPYLKDGFDIQLYDLGDRYFMEAGSGAARKWVGDYAYLLRNAGRADLEDQYEVQLSSQALFQKRINLEGARKALPALSEEFWLKVAERCFECGGCVYECPLCTCFTVVDRDYEGAVERSRLWDACLFKGFTRRAGGCLPHEEKASRIKRWFFHKLVHYPEKFGAFGCVGCGRCGIACPGKIDMASVVSMMKDERGG